MVFVTTKGYAKYSTEYDSGWSWQHFGDGVTIDSISIRREVIRVAGIGCRKLESIAPGRYSVNWGLSFVLTDGGATLGDIKTNLGLLDNVPKAFALEMAANGIIYRFYDNGTGLAYVSRMSVSSRVGEVVRVALEGVAKDVDVVQGTPSGDECGQIGSPETFVEGSVNVGGQSLGHVRSFGFTLNSPVEPIYVLEVINQLICSVG